MRIAKYIFLLLLLLSIAFIVFIATQPNEFNYKSEKTIASSKNTIFQYINDYKNWNSWYPELNANTKTSLSEITYGEGAFINWDATKITTTQLFGTDSIYQLEQEGDKKYNLYWKFHEEKGETKVIWGIKGSLTFNEKLLSFLKGGNEFMFTSKIEQGLENINEYLINEVSNFNILINGVVNSHASYYIQQKDSCSLTEFPIRSNNALQNLQKFVKQNDIVINGDAFIQFASWNINDEPLYFAACIPIEEEILTTPLSDITGHYQEEYSALKITLKGSYSHRKEVWTKALAFIEQNEEYILDKDYKITEIHKKDRSNTTKPSEFITEILIPVKDKNNKPKIVVTPVVIPKPTVIQKTDSIN